MCHELRAAAEDCSGTAGKASGDGVASVRVAADQKSPILILENGEALEPNSSLSALRNINIAEFVVSVCPDPLG